MFLNLRETCVVQAVAWTTGAAENDRSTRAMVYFSRVVRLDPA